MKQYSRAIAALLFSALMARQPSLANVAQQPRPQSSGQKEAQKSEQTTGQSPPVVKLTSTIVQAEVVVTDRRGRQVSNLRAGDFQIVENGRNHPASYCSYIPATEKRTAPAAIAGDGRLDDRELRRTVVFVVFNPLIEFVDLRASTGVLRGPPSQLPNVVRAGYDASTLFARFVDQQMGPRDLIAILREGEPGVLSQLTSDRAALRAVIGQMRLNPMNMQIPPVKVVLRQANIRQSIVLEASDLMQRNLGVIRMMGDVVDRVEKLPGRKLLVLVSRGLLMQGIQGATVGDRMRALIAKANRAGVTIYAINPRGVGTMRGGGLEDLDSLIYLAQQTGGRAIYNTNDLSEGLGEILNENQGYYLVGYQPEEELTATPHLIKVKVKPAELNVLSRAEAYATGSVATGTVDANHPDLLGALNSPLAIRGVPLSLTPLCLSPDGKQARIISLLHVDLNRVKIERQEDGSLTGKLEMVTQVVGPNAQIIDQQVRTCDIKVSSAELARIMRDGLLYKFDTDVAKHGYHQVNVGVKDASSGLVGNASHFIEVPDLTGKTLGLSSLLISESKMGESGIEPLLFSEPGLATLSRRRFARGETLWYMGYVYHPHQPKPGEPSRLMVQARLRHGETMVIETEPRLISEAPNANSTVLVGGGIPLGTLPPGIYTIEMTVEDLLKRNSKVSGLSEFEVTHRE